VSSSSPRFPAVSRAVAAGILEDGGDEYPDDEFDFGLQRVLEGIEALDRSPATAP